MLADGDYYVYFSAPGFASRWERLSVASGRPKPDRLNVRLYRSRWVVFRYTVNRANDPRMTGPHTESGRFAATHWSRKEPFFEDWQVWQGGAHETFGPTPYLQFHRVFPDGAGFGCALAVTGEPGPRVFEGIERLPPDAPYRTAREPLAEGQTWICHISGNTPQGAAFAELYVEAVSDRRPAGVEVIDSPAR
jgi:hypothetical protein